MPTHRWSGLKPLNFVGPIKTNQSRISITMEIIALAICEVVGVCCCPIFTFHDDYQDLHQEIDEYLYGMNRKKN